MSDPEKLADAALKILNYAGPLPVPLSWVLLLGLTILAIGWLIGKWRGR